VIGLAVLAVAGGGIAWVALTTSSSGQLVTITGPITSVDAAQHSVTLTVNGQAVRVKGLTDQEVAALQGQIGKTFTFQATQNSDGTYTLAAGANLTGENATPTATQPATTPTQSSIAFKAGGISFIGLVESVNSSSIVMNAPNGQTFTLRITPQTDFSGYNGSLPVVGSSVNVDAAANPDGSYSAIILKPTAGGPDVNVIAYTGITTSAVGADRVLHLTVGLKSYTFTISPTADLSYFGGNAQAIGNNAAVKVQVRYSGSTTTVVSVGGA